ncbi:transposase [Rufibacter tibetensis]|uniref:transposase n=1 Tax=Rufibacter tibetensis TaxID=512763 RepID=UPI00090050FB|nr:transposase [Rufibacter tibetensis]
MRCYEITDHSWERVKELLPGKSTDVGRTAKDNRQFLNAILWVARSGAPGGTFRAFRSLEIGLPALPPLSQERGVAAGVRGTVGAGPRLSDARFHYHSGTSAGGWSKKLPRKPSA